MNTCVVSWYLLKGTTSKAHLCQDVKVMRIDNSAMMSLSGCCCCCRPAMTHQQPITAQVTGVYLVPKTAEDSRSQNF